MLDDEQPILFGEAQTPLTVVELAAALARHGLRIRVRESSQMTGGNYILVDADSHFQFERINDTEYQVCADDDSMHSLFDTASLVSRALTRLHVRHRFELYQRHNEMPHYLHYGWPATSPID